MVDKINLTYGEEKEGQEMLWPKIIKRAVLTALFSR